MRPLTPLAVGCLMLVVSGCGIVQETTRMFQPNGADYSDFDIDDGKATDEWSIAGREGRGDMPMAREKDGLTDIISSDKARRIARNLGTDSP
ncbi:MAG TPA: hypothetical protein DDY91_17880 [Planctomycetaceae bacterium]|nr:hypothetical protein [Planctomycetaceae bacterium]